MNSITYRHERQKQHIRDDWPVDLFRLNIFNLLAARPTMWRHNTSIEAMGQHMATEATEVQKERNTTTTLFDAQAESWELTDIAWLLESLGLTRGLTLHPYDIKYGINGGGGKSNTLERIAEIAGNLSLRNLPQELALIYSLTLSELASLPVMVDPRRVIVEVENKNSLNHPLAVHGTQALYHPEEDRPIIDPQEMVEVYETRRDKFRDVRDKTKKQGIDVAAGIPEQYWLPFLSLILDLKDPMTSRQNLQHELKKSWQGDKFRPQLVYANIA